MRLNCPAPYPCPLGPSDLLAASRGSLSQIPRMSQYCRISLLNRVSRYYRIKRRLYPWQLL